jgi:RNA polymerase sigma factor (sigma-70 family)
MRPRTSAPDSVLVRRTGEGDERSFEAIFKRHHGPLLSYCRHMLGSRDEGEDALQQAFIKAHRALLGGSVPHELRPWLYAIARNCCLTAIAARRPTTRLEDRAPALGGLSEDVHRREDLRELLAGIGRLPEDQRSALLLAELEDLPHRAIATVVGCEVSKVKALIYQARSSLIADRDARDTSCRDIREQLSVARGGELRRGPLRRHLKLCEGCRDFQLAVSAQRKSFAAVLPVLPSAGLLAAILGHGAAHGAGAAGLVGTSGLASAGGTGAGAATTSGGGAGGLAAAGTTAGSAAGTGTAVGTSAGVGAGTAAGTGAGVGAGLAAGASAGGGGANVGALIGGGLVTKLAVGGAVVAMAAAGTVTVHSREAGATSRRAIVASAAAAKTLARGGRESVAGTSTGPAGPFAPGSAMTLELASATGPASPAGVESLTQLTVLGGANPLLTAAGTLAPNPATPATGGQFTGTPIQEKNSAASGPRAARAKANRARRFAALRHHRELLRRKAARLRRLRAARRRAQRKALRHKHPPIKQVVTPPVAAPPTRPARRRKARPAPSPTTDATTPNASITKEGTKAGTSKRHPRSPGVIPTSSTGASNTTPGTTGTGPDKAGSKTGRSKAQETGPTQATGSGKAQGSGKETEGGASSGPPVKKKTGSGVASGTGKGSVGATSGGGTSETPPNEPASGAGEAAGTGKTDGVGTGRKAAPQKHLVEEEQLPNL